MAIQAITDSEGNVLINGLSVGFELWDAEMAIVLILKLEEFRKALPVIGERPPHWDPLMKPAGLDSSEKDGSTGQQSAVQPGDIHERPRNVRMLQIAVPVREALKLGWGLMEIAKQNLQTPPNEIPS